MRAIIPKRICQGCGKPSGHYAITVKPWHVKCIKAALARGEKVEMADKP